MWPNVLCLSELLFSLPFTNSEVESMFSALKVIKTTSFNTSTLNDLMEINIEGPSFKTFQPTRLWASGGQTVLEGLIKVTGRSTGPEQLLKVQRVTIKRMLPTSHFTTGMRGLCPDS